MQTSDATQAVNLGGALEFESGRKPSLEKEAFLKLLVAQISNQDPLQPQDSDQYMQQLTQFGVLEQLMNLNSGVDTLAVGQLGDAGQQAVRLVGKDVVAKGDTFDHEQGVPSSVDYEAEDAATLTVTVRDANGAVVRTEELPASETGKGTYTWDGQNDDGQAVADGRYSVSIAAETAEGDPVAVGTFVRGRVTGVRFDKGFPELMIGDRRLSLNDVVEVKG